LDMRDRDIGKAVKTLVEALEKLLGNSDKERD